MSTYQPAKPLSRDATYRQHDPSTRQPVNSSTYQLVNISTRQHINLSTYQLVNISTYQPIPPPLPYLSFAIFKNIPIIALLNQINMQQNQLLDEFQPEWVHASHGKRFVNFLIDIIGYYIFIFLSFIVIYLIIPEVYNSPNGESKGYLEFVFIILYFFSFFIYYALFELATGGRSLGKLITGTKAVNVDGSKMSAGTVFKRNIIRMVPFEIFSYFGTPCYPWHDSWSDTMVIDIKKSNALKF